MKKKEEILVRNAKFEDAKILYLLIKEHPREVLPRSVSDIIENIDRFVVAEADGHMVGVASWQILPDIGRAKDPSVEIKSVSVSKDYQGHGVGTALIQSVLKRVKAFNPYQIVVLTFSPGYFKRFGFSEVPKETLMHKLYMGCINCTKYDSPFTCPEKAMTLVLRAHGGD